MSALETNHHYTDYVSQLPDVCIANKPSLYRLYQSVAWCLRWKQTNIIQTMSVSCLMSALETNHHYTDYISQLPDVCAGNKPSLYRLCQSVAWCMCWKQTIIIQNISVSCLMSALETNHHYTDYISQLPDVCIANKPSLYRIYQSVSWCLHCKQTIIIQTISFSCLMSALQTNHHYTDYISQLPDVCIANKPSLYRLYQSVAWCLHCKQTIIIQTISVSCLMSALETNHHYTDYISQLPDVCTGNKPLLSILYQSVAWCLHWKQTIIIETMSVSCLHWKQTINLQIISFSCLMSVFETNHYYPDIISQLSDVYIGSGPSLHKLCLSVVWCPQWRQSIYWNFLVYNNTSVFSIFTWGMIFPLNNNKYS